MDALRPLPMVLMGRSGIVGKCHQVVCGEVHL